MSSMNQSIHIDSQLLPEIEYWKEGEEYELDVKVKMVSVTKTVGEKTRAEFVIMTVEEKPPQEVAIMRHAEFSKAMAEEKRKIAESKGQLA